MKIDYLDLHFLVYFQRGPEDVENTVNDSCAKRLLKKAGFLGDLGAQKKAQLDPELIQHYPPKCSQMEPKINQK